MSAGHLSLLAIPKTFESIIELFIKFARENWILIIATISLAGGLGQFIKLLSISPKLILFFSATQVITEGLLFMLFITSQILIYFLYKSIFNIPLEFKPISNKPKIIPLMLVVYYFRFCIILIYLSLLFTNSINIIFVFPFIPIIFGFLKEIKIGVKNKVFTPTENTYTRDKQSLLIFFLFYLVFFIYKMYLQDFTSLDAQIENFPSYFETPTNMSKDINYSYDLIFYNDKYVIYKRRYFEIYKIYEISDFLKYKNQ